MHFFKQLDNIHKIMYINLKYGKDIIEETFSQTKKGKANVFEVVFIQLI